MISSSTEPSNQPLDELKKKAMIPVRTDVATSASEDYDKSWVHLEQWVEEVISFSSSYSGQLDGSYGPNNLRGPTRVYPRLQSSATSWCPQTVNSDQHVIVRFKTPVMVKEVHVYESSIPGSIIKISCKRQKEEQQQTAAASSVNKKSIFRKVIDKVIGKDDWVVLFERDAPDFSKINTGAVDFSPELYDQTIFSDTIRIDMKLGAGWSEIDGIKLVGRTRVELPKITSLGAHYKKMFDDALFTDLELVHTKSGKTLKVHKSIMTNRSEYFKVISESEMIESKTSVIEFEEDIPYDVFKNVVEFIYTNHIHVHEENIYSVFLLADQFLIGSLSTYCGRLFTTLLEGENVFELARRAKKQNCHKLNEIALEYIVDHYTTLFLTPQFEELDQEDLVVVCRRLAERHSVTGNTTTTPPQVPQVVDESYDPEENCY